MAGGILIIDPESARAEDLAQRLRRLHFEVSVCSSGMQAVAHMESRPADLVMCAERLADRRPREIAEYLQEFFPGHVPFVLLPDDEGAVAERAQREAGADAVLRSSFGDEDLAWFCRLLLDRAALQNRVDFLQEENASLRRTACANSVLDPETGFYRFSAFRHVIAMEIKKARRYGYPLSILLLRLDRQEEIAGWLSPEQRRQVFAGLQREVTGAVRDIDIALCFADQKILVVMPHTALEGAITVADRIRTRIAAIRPPASLAQLAFSASVAVAGASTNELSFGKLIQDTNRGLREAEARGGDVVVVCRDTLSAREAAPLPDGGQLGPRTFFV